jgi:2,4-dienoyl-CoA reductase-like NADH-dependent reductase (Old Yellow Enzyme family)/thioredoxin reductase
MKGRTTMKLLERCNVGSLELKNRMSFPPITTGFGAEGGCFTQEEIDFSVERAKGGASLIFSDAVSIDRHHQLMIANPLPYFDNDEQITKYSRYVDALHHHGAKACIQLYHAGRQTSLAKRGGKSPVGPSAVSSMMLGRIPFPDAVEMSVSEIERVIQAFVLASSRAKTAGFDAVDIDGGAGYLIQQFMSPLTNKRRDCWGGSLENRMRFPLEIIKRIREILGGEYPLIFDICLNEYVEGGITPDEALEMAEILEAATINAFRIHNVNMETYHYMFPGTGSPTAINMPLGRMLKSRLKTAKVMLGQRINDPDLAEKILQKDAADIILLGRPLIADPFFPKKVMQGKKESIRKCIGCNHCVDNLSYAKSIRCALNPVVGFERDYARLPHVNSPKNILVVGGGIAGLEASRVAAEIGHRVILVEKTSELGGQLKYASLTPYKEELRNIVMFYEQQMRDLVVDVRLNLEVDRKIINEIKPDAAIMATGAIPVIPVINGVENTHVLKAEEVLINPLIDFEGQIAVVGGGALGSEIAEIFAMQGREVTLIETKAAIAQDMGVMMALSFHERIGKYSINIITGATVGSIADGKVYYTLDNGANGEVNAGCVVLATGYSANRVLERDLNELVNEVILVGDCQSPRKIINAIHEGFHAARLIGKDYL